MPQRLQTRLTKLFDIEHPVLLAPMDRIAGGGLASAVSAAGGLGVIGGGYGDADWLDAQFAATGNQAVGVGFITWCLARQPELLDQVLTHSPAAVMFSFGDAEDMVRKTRDAGVHTIWQVQRLEQARQALRAGTDVIVVQGQEAGGHGMDRGLMSLLPAVRDLAGDEQTIVAAGGLADGRGLAAALMLGGDGVLMGTRFWASAEADGTDAEKSQLAAAEGDHTVRTKVFDLARGVDWPWHYTGRVVHNAFSEKWHRDIDGLKTDLAAQQEAYAQSAADDFETRVVIGGEAVDLIDSVKPAAEIVQETVRQAAALISDAGNRLAAE
ncbi:MAG: NAD(P)H-dependent flavin oxidoreductase [Methyloligellaceae bacterium]